MTLRLLHEEFIDIARRPMTFDRLPIDAKESDTPVIPMNRWRHDKSTNSLVKMYRFREYSQRDDFVRALLAYEDMIQHRGRISIDDEFVGLRLITKGSNRITELDKEYSKYCDVLYKDITYNSRAYLPHSEFDQP